MLSGTTVVLSQFYKVLWLFGVAITCFVHLAAPILLYALSFATDVKQYDHCFKLISHVTIVFWSRYYVVLIVIWNWHYMCRLSRPILTWYLLVCRKYYLVWLLFGIDIAQFDHYLELISLNSSFAIDVTQCNCSLSADASAAVKLLTTITYCRWLFCYGIWQFLP